jgi:hypothetical protein
MLLPIITAAALFAVGCTPPRSMHSGTGVARAAACKAKDSAADCSILVDAVLREKDNTCVVTVVLSQQTVGFKKDAKDKWIEWELTESASDEGFRFVSDGIAPKAAPAGNIDRWNRNFKNGGADHGGKQFKWKNGNDPAQAGTDYEYMVTVELRRPPAPAVVCMQDPVIRNQR